ncbi:GtrA family protein [Alicyclobacillus fodiniaquatilis]|uniref:GtrA family protein n=1 Tax=Alicyclobacillus fodiniaquatilis TaxID=1661150 RepID=A0ABW4JRW4_9BACL
MTEHARGTRAPLPSAQLLKFAAVGASNSLVDLVLFVVFYHELHLNYIVAHMISYSCGTLNSFVLNKYFTFERRSKLHGQEVYRFVLLNICSFLLSVVFIYGFNHFLHFQVMVSKILSIVLTVIVNYFGSKYWCFAEKKVKSAGQIARR